MSASSVLYKHSIYKMSKPSVTYEHSIYKLFRPSVLYKHREHKLAEGRPVPRYRYWCTVLYVESNPINAQNIILILCCKSSN